MNWKKMLERSFISFVKKNNLIGAYDKLIVAVSGGVDSVVLCELCKRANFDFAMAHVNFGLRGEESNGDEAFVRLLADRLGVELHVLQTDASAYASENKTSVQVAAREARYKWFNELAGNTSVKILTAHHADDNVETMLMHFFRGTGIRGLRGIPMRSGKIVRPLIAFTKKEIVEFAVANDLQWREDSSNASDKYSRNFFRNKIIPAISQVYPEVEANLANNVQRFAEAETLYDEAISAHLKKLVVYKGKEAHVPVLKLKKTAPLKTIVHEIVRSYGFTSAQLDDIIHLLEAPHGKLVNSSTHRVIRNREWLIIAPRITADSEYIIIQESENEVDYEEGRLVFEAQKNVTVFSKNTEEAFLNVEEITYPLILRRWKEGDYFYPLGMRKKKKVARFLIDLKLTKTEKEKVWVLESGKRICWVVGRRIDDRFKTGSPGNVVKVRLVKMNDERAV